MPDYFDEGFSVRKPMWHGLGVVLASYPGRDEAMKLAGHDFMVESLPVYVSRLDEETGDTQEPEVLDDWQAIGRSDTGKVFYVARDTYTIVQNDIPWDIVDAIVAEDNIKYETAGVLKDGGVLWVLVRMDEPYTVKGDHSPIYPYIATSWSHDGTGAIKVDSTDIRVVCWNTYSFARSKADQEGLTFTFRHTERVMERIDAAKEALAGARRKHSAFVELSEELANMPVSDTGISAFLTEFIPQPPGDVVSDRVMRNIEEAREAVLSILNGPSLGDVPLSAYKLFQGGVEYLDHLRGYRNKSTYLNRTLLRREALKDKLLPLVQNIAVEFPVKASA